MAYKLDRESKRIIKEFAAKLNPHPLRDSSGEFIMHQVVMPGWKYIAQCKAAGIKPRIKEGGEINPKKNVYIANYSMSNPEKFLLKAFEKGGPSALEPATVAYLEEQRISFKQQQDELYNKAKKAGRTEEKPNEGESL